MSAKALKLFSKKFKADIIDTHNRLGNETAIVKKDNIHAMCLALRDEPKLAFDYMSDLTVVDYAERQPRFEVVYNLYSMTLKHRIRLRAIVEEGDEKIASVCDIWRAANWAEREAWDMYGIDFEGHPELRRMLMYEEFEGHPLRKDYPIQKSQPRMDLRRPERDAVEEYKHFHVAGNRSDDAR
ncbi:MAG: NADH-quinone oxidoreductase subunit C [Bradymonadia bacterium]|jgi:NADH-quinone oxidoreductase subunit C